MFCPQCGANQSDELKFCKLCGANLYAVRQVVATRDTNEKFDWSKTWVAEMFLSEGERNRRKELADPLHRPAHEFQRIKEIKAGVITASVGVGVGIFLYVFMQGIILSGKVEPGAVEILRRLWVAGVIPFLIGLGLIFNGVVVGRRLGRGADQSSASRDVLQRDTDPNLMRSPGASGLDSPGFESPKFSVTDETTRHLRGPEQNER